MHAAGGAPCRPEVLQQSGDAAAPPPRLIAGSARVTPRAATSVNGRVAAVLVELALEHRHAAGEIAVPLLDRPHVAPVLLRSRERGARDLARQIVAQTLELRIELLVELAVEHLVELAVELLVQLAVELLVQLAIERLVEVPLELLAVPIRR